MLKPHLPAEICEHIVMLAITPRLAALLEAEAGMVDGRLPGVYKDERDGHGTCPWRSGIRREGFEHVKGGSEVVLPVCSR